MTNHPCPNQSHPWWKELVDKVGIFEAYRAFRDNDYKLVDPAKYVEPAGKYSDIKLITPTWEDFSHIQDFGERYNAITNRKNELQEQGAQISGLTDKGFRWIPNQQLPEKLPENVVNSTLKVIKALLTDKVHNLYDKFYKNNPNKFYSELVSLAGKQQVELLKDYNNKNNPTSLPDMLTGIMAEMSYTVEVNTARGKSSNSEQRFIHEMEGGADEDMVERRMLGLPYNYEFNAERYSNTPTQYYSNMIAPGYTPGKGGWEYKEKEIATPDITPSIKGHAQFATDNGIGWVRVLENKNKGIYAVQELQSDLFQKGRDRNDLVAMNMQKSTIDDLLSRNKITQKEYNDYLETIQRNSNRNNFLQLLNKDGNWIPFFIKTIIQDSAKKGYEKVLFPTGDTASKVEGHQTLEDFKRQKEDRIKELEKQNNVLIEKQEDKFVTKSFNPMTGKDLVQKFNSFEEAEENKKLIQRVGNREISQLQEELKRVETEGFAALKPIYNFYENRVHRELEKMYTKEGVTRIKDEYGNEWYEVDIVSQVDRGTIYLQKEASTELPIEELDKIIKKNFQKLGFNTRHIPEGDFAGRVDTLKKVAEVVDGRAGMETWAHEYTHVVLDLLPDDSPILQEIIKDVVYRPEYADIYEQYKDDPEYRTPDGEVDEEKMAKEAASHITDDIIVGKFKEKKALRWWQRLWNWIKSKFSGKKLDVYSQVAEDVLSGDISKLDRNKVGKGTYKQIDPTVAAKMERQRNKLKKEVTEYAKTLRDKESTSTEQKDVISAIVLKEDTDNKLGLRPSPKVELEDNTHTYTDENGIVYNSTTKKITGEFPPEKIAMYELNKDVGNDIDMLGTAAVLGKSFDEMKKLITPTLPDDYKYRIYGDMLRFIDTITSNGEIAIPQVIVSDPVSKTAGAIDIYTVDKNGNQRVYDVKSSVREVKEGKSETYLSEWQQNPGSVFNGLTYKNGELVVRKEGEEPVKLSKKLQHAVQTGSYGRMLELQGGPVVGLYSRHFNVELDHTTWKIKSYKDEGIISHGIDDNKPYVDQVVPTQVDENNLSELQKNRIGYDIVDSDPPTDGEKKEAKEEFQQPLEGTPEIKGLSNKIHEFLGQRVEHMKRLLRDKPDDIHVIKEEELRNLEDLKTIVGAAIDSESYSSLLNTYMDYTINQATNVTKYLRNGMYKKGKLDPRYLDVTRMASAFLEGYRDIQQIAASIPNTQIPKFEQVEKALKAMEDAIDTGNIEYMIADTAARGYQYTKQEIEEAYRGGAKDINVLSRNFLGPSATNSVLVSVFFDEIRRAIFTARDQAKEDAAILDKGLRQLQEVSPGVPEEKITDFMINRSDMTFVKRVGREYEDMKQAAKDALINPDTGERYEYKIGDDEETIVFNKDLYDKIGRYSEITRAEEWIPGDYDPATNTVEQGYYEPGEYCEYAPVDVYNSDGTVLRTLNFEQEREKFEQKNWKGKWVDKFSPASVVGLKWRQVDGKYYEVQDDDSISRQLSQAEVNNIAALQYRNTYKMAVPDKYTPQYKDGIFTGKVIANPEGTIKWVVKGEFKQVRDKSVSGKDLRDPKYVAIMTDNSPKGMAQKSFYENYMNLRHKLSLKLPKSQRKNFMTYLDAVDTDTWAEAYRTGGAKKLQEVLKKKGKKFADISSNPAREVELDEKGDVIKGIPLPITGRYNEKRVKELSAELKAAITPADKRRLKKLIDREKRKVKVADISTDIVHNTKKVSDNIREYDNMSKVESKLLAIQQISESKIVRKKVPLTDAENENVFVRTAKGVLNKIAAMTDNSGYTNEAGMIRDMMNMLVNKDVPYKDTTAAKIEGLLITLLSLRYFAFHPGIALMGRMGNRFLATWPEGVIGEFFTKKQVLQAEGEIQKAIGLWTKNRAMRLAGGGTKFASKLEAWADKFQLHPGSHFSDKTLKSSPQHLSEWSSLMAYAMPMALNTPIKGEDGTIANLWDIFTFDSNTGELNIDKNFEKVFNDQNFKYKLFTKVFDFQNRFEGFYNQMEAATLTQHPGGRSIMFLKKHIPSLVQRIGSTPWVHSNLGYSEGSWYTLWALSRDMREFEGSYREKMQSGMREVIPKGAVGNKGYWKMNEEDRKKADDKAYSEDKEFQNADGTVNEEKVERDRQKRKVRLNNLKRDLTQVVSICVFFGAYMLFKALAEDDETEARRWNNYLARTFDKLRKQQMFAIPVIGFEEQYQLLKSPLASLRVVGDLADTIGDTIGLAIPGIESRYTTGVHAGELKAWTKAKKMVPVLNLEPYLDELNSANYWVR